MTAGVNGDFACRISGDVSLELTGYQALRRPDSIDVSMFLCF